MSDSTKPPTEASAATPEAAPRRADPRLLELLVCPLTRTTLVYDRERQELVSHAGKLAYPIRDGIPILFVEEARLLDPDQPRPIEG